MLKYLVTIIFLSFISCTKERAKKTFIVSRDIKQIDTNDVFRYGNDYKKLQKWIIIHHSSLKQQPGIEVIEHFHVNKFGYDDIGYHYIIEKNGDIYEGRSIKYMGAHAGQTKEANTLADSIRAGKSNLPIEEAIKLDPDYGAIGICLDGNFDLYEPNSKQLNSVKLLLRQLKKEYSIENENILMHSEVKSNIIEKRGLTFIGKETICPGKFSRSRIKRLIQKL